MCNFTKYFWQTLVVNIEVYVSSSVPPNVLTELTVFCFAPNDDFLFICNPFTSISPSG